MGGVENYVDSQMNKYLWVLFGISCFAILFNLLPPVKNWLERLRFESLEAAANDTKATALGDSTDELQSGPQHVVDVSSIRSIKCTCNIYWCLFLSFSFHVSMIIISIRNYYTTV